GSEHRGLRGHGDRLAAYLRHRLGDDAGRAVPLVGAAQHVHVPAGLHVPEPRLRVRDRRGDLRAGPGLHHHVPDPGHKGGGVVTAATLTRAASEQTAETPANRKRRRWVFHAVMAPLTLLWVAPMIFVLVL